MDRNVLSFDDSSGIFSGATRPALGSITVLSFDIVELTEEGAGEGSFEEVEPEDMDAMRER
jgi:hypothetical protein